MIFTAFLVVFLTMDCSSSPASATFRECSVNISNVVSNLESDALVVDCMKGAKHYIFTPQVLPPGKQYYGWKFVPNIWSFMYYQCDFTWSTHFKRVNVWYDTTTRSGTGTL